MKDIDFCKSFHGFTLRPARPEDAAAYFEQNFAPLDPEVARLTGCKSVFSRREGVLRDAVLSGGRYADDILMAILEDEWREIKKKEL